MNEARAYRGRVFVDDSNAMTPSEARRLALSLERAADAADVQPEAPIGTGEPNYSIPCEGAISRRVRISCTLPTRPEVAE